MPIGITNTTNVSMAQLLDIANSSTYPEFMVKVNTTVYVGRLFFILLCVLWFILFVAAQNKENQILTNAMYSGAVVSVISLFLRAIQVYYAGTWAVLLTDHQMWMFPVLTACIAVVLWLSKQ